jgi:hypothetical protein
MELHSYDVLGRMPKFRTNCSSDLAIVSAFDDNRDWCDDTL